MSDLLIILIKTSLTEEFLITLHLLSYIKIPSDDFCLRFIILGVSMGIL